MRTFIFTPAAAALALLSFGSAADLRAQTQNTVWAGIYSAEQAARGKTAYDQNCGGCHGPYLEGFRTTGSAKALARDPFLDRWDGGTVDELYQFIRANMPKTTAAIRSDAITDAAKLDIVAYILQVNEFPAGSAALDPAALGSIQIRSKEGIRPLKNGMTVEAVGCVTQEGSKWLITKATQPLRTRTDKLSSGAALAAASARTGTLTVELVDAIPEPTGLKGQKIEVKGLYMETQPPGINVLDMQKVAESCN